MAPEPTRRRGEIGEDVGTQLRSARNSKGVSRSEAARELEVPEQFLADLEEGRLWPFGPRMHIAAYVRVYARYLGLDPDSVLGRPSDEPVRGIGPLAGGLRLRWVLASAVALVGLGALVGVTVVLTQDSDPDSADVKLAEASDSEGHDSGSLDETQVRSRSDRQPRLEENAEDAAGPDPPQPFGQADSSEGPSTSTEPEEGGQSREEHAVGEGLEVQLLDGAEDPARLEGARQALVDLGYEIAFVDRTAGLYEETTVLHTEEFADQAARLLAADDRFTRAGDDPGLAAPADLHVVVGLDWPEP